MRRMALSVCIAILILALFFFGRIMIAQEEKMDAFDKWFNWKVKNVRSLEQKEVIEYFEVIDPIFEKSLATVFKTNESVWGHPNPSKAVELVNAQIEAANKIKPPKLCNLHYELTIQILKLIKEYQIERSRLIDNKSFETRINEDRNFEAKIRNTKIERMKLEEKRQKEYFNILHKVGFYNNAIKEMHKLRLITTEERNKLEQE